MTRIKIVLWVLCGVLTVLWFAADPVLRGAHPFAQTQIAFINYTGIVAMGAMSVAMLLALRSVRLEPYVGGLDKSYRLRRLVSCTRCRGRRARWARSASGPLSR